ncbi:N-acetylmuramoyl-L-alanine amidase [Clostridium tagluense]|uniref:N-acetylmuramoyl-L-alanine amidase n=1 Tax=Clostridium tagluense TaxID=360422 RepID=UPI001CF4115A|nr:N-acetylmuramoyl-L-alanine amidase [Clostridium tagluense]MCB2310317.1 N-acetylmuramoyl-L-alanine amidase [Clostridium tagluense]MCB2315041.1 N-acetylmuramoyl-L-alanine amidase [Clostridium tagluense]MCB2320017.1 N-acetylmuramoyl-L-alanine amidase [Clostridium tagluense]MCB2324784.1 N-acetylmuramoyl-L-alanine amidase [Clostridium tagluense]MCB2329762.1 N-acetylmuramoyl-L-alanine amidase [Clostridium tagluense]
MKNIFKSFLIVILTFALCIPMQIIVKASTYADIGTKNNVVVSKPWTVSFNKSLSSNTVNTTNIKVLGEANKSIDVDVSLANNNKNVIVKPIKNYEANSEYTLIVTEKVKSSDGKDLPKEVRMSFNTESAATKPSEFTVCIDPAQYYKDITGKNGAKAKDVNLNTALKLGNILKTRGFNVVYTRDSDSVTWDKLNEDEAKAAIAKKAKADVFLSINTNAYSSDTANGIETYYLSDISNNKVLAELMQSELIKATEAKDRGIKAASKEENLAILNKLNCPGVVLELGFLSNPEEEILLTNADYQNNAAKAIANALMKYTGFANTDTSYDSPFQISSVGDTIVNLEVGGKYAFPKTILATMTNNSKKEVGVEWLQDLVSFAKSGTYTYEGVIKNYDKKAKVIINVKEAVKNKYSVVLDAGHGGADSGAVGQMGTKEKTIVLAITLKVGNILAKNGVGVTYTRTTDKTQGLQQKCDVSNNAKPNYFVSIHANSYSAPTVSGIETFYKSGSAAGQKLAQAVQTELIKATGRVDRKIKTAGFYVLNNTNATAILVETSFVSNPTEEKLLVTEAYQTKLAQAISTGILKSLGISKIVF